MKIDTSRMARALLRARTLTARALGVAFFALAFTAPLTPARAADEVNLRDITGVTSVGDSGISNVVVDGVSQPVHIFTNVASDTLSFTLPKAARVRYLLVGGGGAGASPGQSLATEGGAGGGGAGGLIDATKIFMPGTYAIRVGAGGAAGTAGETAIEGDDGDDTTITTDAGATVYLLARGGGGGGIKGPGRPGGSGGGGSSPTSNTAGLGGAAENVTEGIHHGTQGSAGGSSAGWAQAGAGGGGAGGVGGSPTGTAGPGAGGAGKSSEITGESKIYAVGGKGGRRGNATAPKGGLNPGTGNGGDGAGWGALPPPGRGRAGAPGDSGIVVLRVTEAMPMKPTSTNFFYTGEVQTNVFDGAHCLIFNDETGKTVDAMTIQEPGTNTYTVSLKTGYVWANDGSTEAETVTVVIDPTPVERPQSKSVPYDGLEHEILFDTEHLTARTLAGEGVLTNRLAATEIGSHIFTVALNRGCVWADDGSSEPIDVRLKITRELLRDATVSMDSWTEGDTPNQVVVTSTPSLSPSDYTVEYLNAAGGQWTSLVPSVSGEYVVKVTVLASPLFDLPDDLDLTTTFTIHAKPNIETATGAASFGEDTKTTAENDEGIDEPVYIYTNLANMATFTLKKSARIRYLLVGGGGAGASPGNSLDTEGGAGGGGAGGMIEAEAIFPAGKYSIHVGAGGAAGTAGQTAMEGDDGDDTTITNQTTGAVFLLACGGGGGGIKGPGRPGGSGGGGSSPTSNTAGLGGAAENVTEGIHHGTQGSAGGSSAGWAQAGAGGGGAGGVGGSPTGTAGPGAGGAGKPSEITGESKIYAVGGKGGRRGNATAPKGGLNPGTGNGGDGAGWGALPPPGRGRAGAPGDSGIVVLRVLEVMPEKPVSTNFVYDATEHVLYHAPAEVDELVYYGADGQAGTADDVVTNRIAVIAGGVHKYRATLKSGYAWAEDGSTAPAEVVITVEKANLVVSSLAIDGWQVGEELNVLEVASTPRLFPSDYTVYYRPQGAGDTAWTTTVPTAAGLYQATIRIDTATQNFNLPAVIDKVADFEIKAWVKPDTSDASNDIPGLGYYAKFKVKGLSSKDPDPGEMRLIKLELADNQPKGFFYRYAQADGSDLRFQTADGRDLRATIESWNDPATGLSTVIVEVPASKSETYITMFWGLLVSGDVPEREAVAGTSGSPIQVFAFSPDWTYTRENAFFQNRWVVEPEVSPTEWMQGDEPLTLSSGYAAYSHVRDGAAHHKFVRGDGSAVTNVAASALAAGTYVFSGFVEEFRAQDDSPGTISWEALEHPGYAVIVKGASPDTNVTYSATDDVSASGRILLANNYTNDTMKVGGQEYPTTNASGTYWTSTLTAAIGAFALSDTVNHKLTSFNVPDDLYGDKTLWTLHNIRLGNLYTSASATKNKAMNYLPATEDGVNQVGAAASHLVFRNTAADGDGGLATLYSPCYSNGIGTIYFDAVNSATNDVASDGWALQLCISTNALDEASLTSETTEWTPVELTVLKTTDGRAFVRDGVNADAGSVAPQVSLAINAGGVSGGSTRRFYRVCARVNESGPIRFRLQRVEATDKGDDEDFILVDNVIVSKMPMRAELTPTGFYDATKTGKQVLGQELAWTKPYPSIKDDEFKPRAKMTYYGTTNETEAAQFVTGAKLRYRWRYLNQQFNPARVDDQDSWSAVALNPASDKNYTALFSLENLAPENGAAPEVGDVEFWYEVYQNAPYYTYYDYSGANLHGKSFYNLYTEHTPIVTNRCTTLLAPYRGTDWFVRLREGKSNYQAVNLVVFRGTRKVDFRDDSGTITNTVEVDVTEDVPMELVGNNLWRGYLKTPTNQVGTLKYRFHLVNGQADGAMELVASTNYWSNGATLNTTPVTSRAEACAATAWTPIHVDAVTGYLLFQLDDALGTLSIVHADYQNFNSWADAKGDIFVGTSSVWEHKSGLVGTSSKKQSWTADYGAYLAMPSTNANWKMPSPNWTDIEPSHMGNHTPYEAFSAGDGETCEQWDIGAGMWVAQVYRDSKANSGVALQMQGQGQGSFQLTNRDYLPRGIESVSFNARLGQSIAFNDFVYYDAASKMSMSNYTFMSYVAFDTNENKNFRGNASLSLVAYHMPGYGCYELRLEQRSAKWTGTTPSYNNKGQRLSLYRWKVDTTGRLAATLLGSASWSNGCDCDIPGTTGENGNYLPMYLAVETLNNETVISAGFAESGLAPGSGLTSLTTVEFNNIYYRDSSTDRLTGGTYGVLSANCPGVFQEPRVMDKLANPLKDPYGVAGEVHEVEATKPAFQTATAVSCQSTLEIPNLWINNGGARMVPFPNTTGSMSTGWGLQASPYASQTVRLYTRPATGGKWAERAAWTINDYGSLSEGLKKSINLWTPETLQIRMAVDGDLDDARRDIVVDSFEVRQWAGADWDNYNDAGQFVKPAWDTAKSSWGLTNFVFTKGWTLKGGLLMAAKRAKVTEPISIRSPLMDNYEFWGGTSRGSGLGMISFNYENAHTNTVLLLQIATNNVSVGTLGNLDGFNDSLWTTVTNFSFEAATDEERKSGTRNAYLGLHGVNGLMRLVIATNIVAEAQSSTNPDYGSIVIKKIFCRDEPTIDLYSWWGWNLRTLGPDTLGNHDTENRMYLPDLAEGAGLPGLSLALNNSVTEGISDDPLLKDDYKQHLPFVQTPTFTSNIVGSVTFKARNYDGDENPAYVAVYGASTGNVTEDSHWHLLTNMPVTAKTYKTYSYTTAPGETYAAFRLAVTGVGGVTNYMQKGTIPGNGDAPVRVLIDEVLVSEALRARMAFRNVGAFRSFMNELRVIPNMPNKDEQPLCNEGWGVQCEVIASQLADEIDTSREPIVFLHWFEGQWPWGFENWKDNKKARRARLDRVPGETNLVYRSTKASTYDNVIPMSTTPGTVMQYMLEVRYWEKTSGQTATTNYLNAGEWTRPDWYKPVDHNAGKDAFSAYSILDTVSPGWAWINEVNIYSTFDWINWENKEANAQFVEIAVPQSADISGWSIRFLGPRTNQRVYTNDVAYFGTTTLPGRQVISNPASNMVFRVIGGRLAHKALGGRLDPEKGEIDDYWTWEDADDNIFWKNDSIDWSSVIGIQLIRASGIVEHEISCIGTNRYETGDDWYDAAYKPEYAVEYLEKVMPNTKFTYMGEDIGGDDKSLSVLTGRGATTNDWKSQIAFTPGKINQDQVIEGEPPTPNGDSIIVFANIDNRVGHLYQTVGDVVMTNASTMVFVKIGSSVGTNITYTADAWWELATVTTNGNVDIAATAQKVGPRVYRVNVGAGVSNNVTVTASARMNSDLSSIYGLTKDNRYTPAVLDWLMKGATLRGGFANPDSDTIALGEFWRLNDEKVRDMTLTEMYWLDMDPTVSNLVMKAGFTKAPTPKKTTLQGFPATDIFTNVTMAIQVIISNKTDDTSSAYYSDAWTPYTLRGLGLGEHSADSARKGSWTSATFKVTGIINNGQTSRDDEDLWVSLRWFTFTDDSFYPLNDPQYPGWAFIDVIDPFSKMSPGYTAGWYDWVQDNPDKTASVWYSFRLNEWITPFGVEKLNKQSLYKEAE